MCWFTAAHHAPRMNESVVAIMPDGEVLKATVTEHEPEVVWVLADGSNREPKYWQSIHHLLFSFEK